MARLIPCASCARHVRDTDSACPFCGAAAPVAPPQPPPLGKRLPRSALIAAGIAGSLAATDCASHAQPLYGSFGVIDGDDGTRDEADAQVGDATQTFGDDAELPVPLYGGGPIRPEDAGAGAPDAAEAQVDAADAGAADAEAADAAPRDAEAGAVQPSDADVEPDR